MGSFLYPTTYPLTLSGKTLIVSEQPVVSTANVSQLAVDLLIASLSLERLAILNPEFLVPVVGGREESEEGLTTPAEYALTTLPIAMYTSPVLQSPHESVQEVGVPFIPGGGLTRRIMASLPPNWNIPTASLLQFVLEGDNRGDARLLAAVVAKVIGHDVLEWQQPNSWNVGLFGAPHDQTLYG
ncbi:hypothetical protein C0993_009804 [Termitomyces sp. T159_Od127]|nr:hypothetical protein C0993_009804 [Termitomyces sp. T159_Od127]